MSGACEANLENVGETYVVHGHCSEHTCSEHCSERCSEQKSDCWGGVCRRQRPMTRNRAWKSQKSDFWGGVCRRQRPMTRNRAWNRHFGPQNHHFGAKQCQKCQFLVKFLKFTSPSRLGFANIPIFGEVFEIYVPRRLGFGPQEAHGQAPNSCFGLAGLPVVPCLGLVCPGQTKPRLGTTGKPAKPKQATLGGLEANFPNSSVVYGI